MSQHTSIRKEEIGRSWVAVAGAPGEMEGGREGRISVGQTRVAIIVGVWLVNRDSTDRFNVLLSTTIEYRKNACK